MKADIADIFLCQYWKVTNKQMLFLVISLLVLVRRQTPVES